MFLLAIITPFRRDVLLATVALLFLLSPVWVPVTNISETTYTYERAEVVVDEENGITYADDPHDPQLYNTHISEEIGCSTPRDTRVCAFERYLLSNTTIPTEVYTNNPSLSQRRGIDRYQYVQINGSVYEPTSSGNRSAQRDDGLYRVDLELEPTSATDALRDVSIDVATESEEAPSVVVEAAEQGTATADREVEISPTPLRVDGDTYYRVYVASQTAPTPTGSFLGTILPIIGPLAGLSIGFRISRRIEVRYIGENDHT